MKSKWLWTSQEQYWSPEDNWAMPSTFLWENDFQPKILKPTNYQLSARVV